MNFGKPKLLTDAELTELQAGFTAEQGVIADLYVVARRAGDNDRARELWATARLSKQWHRDAIAEQNQLRADAGLEPAQSC